MIGKIQKALKKNSAIKAWTIRHEMSNGRQQYEIKDSTEATRDVATELFTVDVLCDSENAAGEMGSGLGTVSLLPEGDIDEALEKAVMTAKLVHNQPYDFIEPTSIPELELADKDYIKDPEGGIQAILDSLKETTTKFSHVRMTAAECFGEEKTTHLVSSKGIDASQTTTQIYLQWVYLGGSGEDEVETFSEIHRRRVVDLDIAEEAALRAQYTSDLLEAEGPPSYSGPIYVQGPTLAVMVAGEMLSGSLMKTLSSAAMKYSGETPWEIGESIFRGEVKGDPLNLWANRQLPYGVPSSAFDNEGIPAGRIPLIQDNKLESYIADQRFADYLDIPPTGAFGSVEIPAGNTSMSDLQSGAYVEISDYSWFNPNPITGDFACEIRLGYLVENGSRTPFKGGMLVGNLLDALADMRWSKEIGFFGNYLGPKSALFTNLQISG